MKIRCSKINVILLSRCSPKHVLLFLGPHHLEKKSICYFYYLIDKLPKKFHKTQIDGAENELVNKILSSLPTNLSSNSLGRANKSQMVVGKIFEKKLGKFLICLFLQTAPVNTVGLCPFSQVIIVPDRIKG